MAKITNLPPQAYTRDTLVKAIDWVNTQSPAVRERANSADLIVSYYLQARRRADAQMEAPVSGENFKADLKHLAQDLRQFEEPSPPQPVPTMSRPFSPSRMEEVLPHSPHQPHFEPQPPQAPIHQPMAPIHQPAPARATGWQVDARSMDCAHRVIARMNLSHETEALRLLITLGMEKFREMFP